MSTNGGQGGALHNDLRNRVSSRQVVFFVGAGATIAATNNAKASSWKGLLEHGLQRCVDLATLDSAQATNLQMQLDSSDIDLWLTTAQLVEKKLKRISGEYGLWLHETLGALKVSQRGVVDALAETGLPIFTTNYDGIFEQVTGAPAVTWRQSADMQRILRGEMRGIAHLHGYFGDPDSVVLGVSSYEDVLRDPPAQAALRALWITKTIVFVGFGMGILDPNFDALLRWARRACQDSPYRHYRLARDSECEAIREQHSDEDRVFPVAYGAEHSDLEPFLRSLCTAGPPVPTMPVRMPSPPPISREQQLEAFHSEIDLAKEHIKRAEPDFAILILEKLRSKFANDFDGRVWYRVLVNIGQAYEQKEEFAKAGMLYVQAVEHDPSNVDAQCFAAIGHLLLGSEPRALGLALEVRERHRNSTLAHAVCVRAAPLEIPFAAVEADVPEHLRSVLEVSHALMLAALSREQLGEAEHYGRLALVAEPESPLLTEQLGCVLVERARYELRETDAELLPISARSYAEEASKLLGRAAEICASKGTAIAKARIYLALSTACRIAGRTEDQERYVRLAYDIAPDNHDAIFQFGSQLAASREFTAAIALFGKLRGIAGRAALPLIVARLHLARGEPGDREEALAMVKPLVADLDSLDPRSQFECVATLLGIYADMGCATEAEAILSELTGNPFLLVLTDTLRAGYLRKCGNLQGAKSAAIRAHTSLFAPIRGLFKSALAAELTSLSLHTEAFAVWAGLVTPSYVGVDTQMAVYSAIHAEEPAFVLDFCNRLRGNGFFDVQCIRAELETLNRFNCVDALGRLMEQCLSKVADERFRNELRVQRSLLGLELGRDAWVTFDPARLPSAMDAPPHVGRAVVQILSAGPEPMLAVRYAYELLRVNFGSEDANIGMIGALLMRNKEELHIPEPDVVGPGVAVGYSEGESPTRWWIIEDLPAPDRGRRELAPDHPLAAKMQGKKVGDEIVIRESPLGDRVVRVTEITSKFVYRFQQCMDEFEEYFLGQSFLMKFTTKRPDTDQPDLGAMMRSVEHRIQSARALEDKYTRQLPSTNFFAMQTGEHIFESTAHLVEVSRPVYCCQGTNAELEEAASAVGDADTIVIDGSALATLFMTDSWEVLRKIRRTLVISYGTFRELRQLLLKRVGTGPQGFLTKVEERLVIQEQEAEQVQRYSGAIQGFLDVIASVATIEEGRPFSELSPQDRSLLDKGVGRSCGETIALARRKRRALWLDDLPVAVWTAKRFGVRWSWTQSVVSFAQQQEWVTEDCVSALSLKLLKLRYDKTRVLPSTMLFAANKAAWVVSDAELALALSWLGDRAVPTKAVIWVAINTIDKIMRTISPDQGEAVVIAILGRLSSRVEGHRLLVDFRANVDMQWKDSGVNRERLKALIQQVIDRHSAPS